MEKETSTKIVKLQIVSQTTCFPAPMVETPNLLINKKKRNRWTMR